MVFTTILLTAIVDSHDCGSEVCHTLQGFPFGTSWEWNIWCGRKQIYSSKHDTFVNNKIVTSMTICIDLETVSGFKMVLKYPPSEILKNIYY